MILTLLAGFAAGVGVFLLIGRAGEPPEAATGVADGEASLLREAELARARLAASFPALALDALDGAIAERGEKTVRLSEADLRDLLLAGLERHENGRLILQIAEGMETHIDEGEVGVMLAVDPSRIPRERLSDKERRIVDSVTELVPLLGRSNLPVGLYGRPEASDGRIRLAGDPRVKISLLQLSVASLAERLDLSPAEVEEALVLELPGYEVREITVGEDHVEVRVAGVA